MKVGLFDYGAGNLHSLGKALEAAGTEVMVSSDWEAVLACDALVLPGVGAFGPAARALPDDRAPLLRALAYGHPCLGICLGMQLLFDRSEEAEGDGIGLVPGVVRRLDAKVVPHMGWNDVSTNDDVLFASARPLVAYYANSFVCEPKDKNQVIAWSACDDRRFVAGVRAANTWGVQFHPEKSSTAGRRIITNFVEAARTISRLRGGAR
jgi:glutamine amidotransferase